MTLASFSEISDGITARVRLACEGLKVQRIAEITGGNRETVRRYLGGESEPCAAFLAALCQGLNLSPAWLLLGIGTPQAAAEIKLTPESLRSNKDAVAALVRELSLRLELLG